jgi:hypothetical protein
MDDVTQRARTALIKMKVVEELGRSARDGRQRALGGKGKDISTWPSLSSGRAPAGQGSR